MLDESNGSSEEPKKKKFPDFGGYEPELTQARGNAEPTEGRCNRELKNTDPARYCSQYPAKGEKHCKRHMGGVATITNSGVMSSNFKTGKYSKYFPSTLRAQYEKAINDRTLLSLNDEIAAIEAMIGERFSRIGESVSNDWWFMLRSTAEELVRAQKAGKVEQAATLLSDLVGLIRQGSDIGKLFDEASDLIERKSRVVQREWKRLVDMQHVLTADRAVSFVQAISMSVKEHVKDRNVIRKIAMDMERLIGVETKFSQQQTRETDPDDDS